MQITLATPTFRNLLRTASAVDTPVPEFPPNDHLISVLEEGLDNHEVVRIDYVTKGGYYLANQDVEPLKIKKPTGAGHVILKAYCRNQEGIRHYRIERILDAEKTGQTFEVQQDTGPAESISNAPDLLTVLDGDGPLSESSLQQAMVKEGVKLAGEVIREQMTS